MAISTNNIKVAQLPQDGNAERNGTKGPSALVQKGNAFMARLYPKMSILTGINAVNKPTGSAPNKQPEVYDTLEDMVASQKEYKSAMEKYTAAKQRLADQLQYLADRGHQIVAIGANKPQSYTVETIDGTPPCEPLSPAYLEQIGMQRANLRAAAYYSLIAVPDANGGADWVGIVLENPYHANTWKGSKTVNT